MAKFRALTDEDYVKIGKQHGSDDVAAEVGEAVGRWQEDLAVLAGYGLGQASLGLVQALVVEHGKARQDRPGAVAAKATAVKERDAKIGEAWEWMDQSVSALSVAAADSAALADALNAAVAADTAALDASVRSVAVLLTQHKSALDPGFDAEAMIGRAETLAGQVRDRIAGTALAKDAPKEDTREIDLLDGKIVAWLRRVNRAGRKAFRRLDNDVKVKAYRYHHLNSRTRKGGGGAPSPEPTPA